MRTLVLVAGVLLVAALAVFLTIGKWKSPFSRRDIPKRLGIEIQEESNGVTYTQSRGGHTLFKIHASKVVQLKQGKAVLHDVKIDLFGADGNSVDRIEGNEFEYDTRAGVATAAGPVQILLMRPGVAPAIKPGAAPDNALGGKQKSDTLAAAAHTAVRGQIQVKTSGLTFDQNSGVARTSHAVEFSIAQGSGRAVGASYDSQTGRLVLDRAVQLHARRGADPVQLQAQHAVFERGDAVCLLSAATASYRGGQARADEATIQFRDDGSAARLDVAKGFILTTTAGGSLAAPTGSLVFDEHNQPRHGHLDGGVTIDSDSDGRKVHGTSPAMDLEFTGEGVLRSAHLEHGVRIASQEQTRSAGGLLRTERTWASPVADVEFRDSGHGKVELAAIHGKGGVVVTGESQHGNGPASPSRMTADDVTGTFGANSALTALTGAGHAGIEQTTPAGTRQTTRGDRLTAHFAAGPAAGAKTGGKGEDRSGAEQIQSATVEGNVVLVQQPESRPGAATPSALRATADRAVYEGAGEWLHLSGNPRVEDGGLQLAADRIDVSQASGDAFAHGDVKATWMGTEAGRDVARNRPAAGQGNGPGSVALGGEGPAHAIAAEAQLHQATGEATFRGQARLWQQANSIAAPVIVLDRARQTLVARAAGPAEPVRVVLVTAASPGSKPGKSAAPSVIRIRGGNLKYSAAERKVVIEGGAAGSVVAETADATTVAAEVELLLLPPGNHAGKDGAAAQVDRMTARGHVDIRSQGRRGTGEQLVYSSETGDYVLTGTAAAPPRMTDPARGSVTGEALIFNSRDDSVSIEGGGRKTTTETTAPR
jgi:lipopolysaccharide export system protein LptA